MTLYEIQMTLWPGILARFEHKVQSQTLVRNEYGCEENTCFYRKDGDPNNLDPSNCCGIGAAIAPENYKSSFETKTGGFISDEAFPESTNLDLFNKAKFKKWLMDIQEIHDYSPFEDWDILLSELKPKEPV